MCEKCETRGVGWRGWQPLPAVTLPPTAGPWLDLSHPVSLGMPRAHVFPPPRFEHFMELPNDPINVTRFEMIVHTGTHVDAPRHFYNDGPAFDEIPWSAYMVRASFFISTWRPAESLILPISTAVQAISGAAILSRSIQVGVKNSAPRLMISIRAFPSQQRVGWWTTA